MSTTITPTEHEKREWRRMATAAYGEERNDIGHRYSAYGALRIGESISVSVFDTLQDNYRAWLIGGFDLEQVSDMRTAIARVEGSEK